MTLLQRLKSDEMAEPLERLFSHGIERVGAVSQKECDALRRRNERIDAKESGGGATRRKRTNAVDSDAQRPLGAPKARTLEGAPTRTGSLALEAGPPQKPARTIRASFSGSEQGGLEAYDFGAAAAAASPPPAEHDIVVGSFADFFGDGAEEEDGR
jgi:hypothetical protein